MNVLNHQKFDCPITNLHRQICSPSSALQQKKMSSWDIFFLLNRFEKPVSSCELIIRASCVFYHHVMSTTFDNTG